MPKNKYQRIRYQTLDKCFRNKTRNYFFEDLLEACRVAIEDYSGNSDSIKKSQLYKDLQFMKSDEGYKAPIIKGKEGRRVYYYYSDRNFTINKQPLTEEEAKEFKEAIETFSRFKGLPQFEWMDNISTRLEVSYQLGEKAEQIIEFDQNSLAIGVEFIQTLYHAVSNCQAQSIKYKSFKVDKPNVFVFHPYYLKQYNHRWYVMGLNPKYSSITRLALDRILSIEPSQNEFIPNLTDFKNYFNNMIGVSNFNDSGPENVLIRVYRILWDWIRTKPIHHSQQIFRETDTFVEIKLHLIVNYELETTILQFGEKVEVVSPPSLRAKILERNSESKKNYEKK